MITLLIAAVLSTAADDADALRGPRVAPHGQRTPAPSTPAAAGASETSEQAMTTGARTAPRTIVERSFEGRIVPIEGEVEAAALRALPLTEAQRRTVDAVVSRRIEHFDALVRAHLLELERAATALGRLEHAESGGERWAAIADCTAAWSAFQPWRDRGTIVDEVGDAIPIAYAERARRLAHDYRAAIARERAAELSLHAAHPQIQAQTRLESFGALVQASFERQQRGGEADLERFVREVQLTPEQTERARTIFGDLALREMRREATAWDRIRAFSSLMQELTPKQRARAWRLIRRDSR